MAELISPTMLYVCTKFPHCSRVLGSMCSASSPCRFRHWSTYSNMRRASSRSPIAASALMYQKVQTRNAPHVDRKSTRLNSSHVKISYAVFCLKKKTIADVGGLIFTLILLVI